MVQATQEALKFQAIETSEEEIDLCLVWVEAAKASISAGHSAVRSMEMADDIWQGFLRRKAAL